MINQLISSKNLIFRISDDYNIESSDYIGKLPTWVMNTIHKCRIPKMYELGNHIIHFNNNKCFIPQCIEKIHSVLINGDVAFNGISSFNKNTIYYGSENVVGLDGKVYHSNVDINTTSPKTFNHNVPNHNPKHHCHNSVWDNWFNINNMHDKGATYDSLLINVYNINNGWMHMYADEGIVEILGLSIPVEFDADLELYFPMIPNNEYFILTCIADILKNILMRGYIHPILKLDSKNEFTNPALLYENNKRKAEQSCNILSPELKASLSKIMNQHIL